MEGIEGRNIERGEEKEIERGLKGERENVDTD